MPLLVLYGQLRLAAHNSKYPLNQKAEWRSTEDDIQANDEIMSRADWDADIALAAMKLCHKQALSRNDVPRSFSYYVPAIDQALTAGVMPGSPKGGNGGKRSNHNRPC